MSDIDGLRVRVRGLTVYIYVILTGKHNMHQYMFMHVSVRVPTLIELIRYFNVNALEGHLKLLH